jgi:FMN phosphatase YigB (HAD superfamily)
MLGYEVNLHDFNRHVFKGLQYHTLDIREVDVDLHGLKTMLHAHDTYVFSNSPDEWIIETLYRVPAARPLIEQLRILSARHDQDEKCIVKPDPAVFQAALDMLRPEDHLYLVDDAFLNIESATRLMKSYGNNYGRGYVGLWLTHHATSAFDVNDRIRAIHNLDDAAWHISQAGDKK